MKNEWKLLLIVPVAIAFLGIGLAIDSSDESSAPTTTERPASSMIPPVTVQSLTPITADRLAGAKFPLASVTFTGVVGEYLSNVPGGDVLTACRARVDEVLAGSLAGAPELIVTCAVSRDDPAYNGVGTVPPAAGSTSLVIVGGNRPATIDGQNLTVWAIHPAEAATGGPTSQAPEAEGTAWRSTVPVDLEEYQAVVGG